MKETNWQYLLPMINSCFQTKITKITNFGNLVSATISLTTSQYLKIPDNVSSDINECYFLILYDKIHKLLEDVHNAVNQDSA